VRGRDALTGGQFPTCRDVRLWCWICRVKDKASRLTYSGGVPILGANFESESGPAIPLNVSLLIKFGDHPSIWGKLLA